jgi:predicted MarR family transcription regulator
MSLEKEKGVLSLEEKHMIAILLFLSINGQCRKIEVYQNVSSNPRIPEKLDRLEAMGLITQTIAKGSRSVTVALTSKGKEVANMLQGVDRIVKSD